MKIAALSDIHGNLPALDAVLADIATTGADVIVNLGDSLSGPLQVAQTAARLRAANLPSIAGNHERQLLDVWRGPVTAIDTTTSDGYAATELDDDIVAWLAALPPHHWLTPRILLAHGTPGSDLHYWLETVTPDAGIAGSRGLRAATHDEARERLHTLAGAERASLIFCGHTHVPRAMQCGETVIVNPGSVGLQAYTDDHPYRHAVEVGTPHARYALVNDTRQGWHVEWRQVAYDWESQAKLAALRGRDDWAVALRTGRMTA